MPAAAVAEAPEAEVLPVVPLAERKGLGPWPWYVVLGAMIVAAVIFLL
jgi:uncharacterized membrane protein YwaF